MKYVMIVLCIGATAGAQEWKFQSADGDVFRGNVKESTAEIVFPKVDLSDWGVDE